jgi:hypothetical protein
VTLVKRRATKSVTPGSMEGGRQVWHSFLWSPGVDDTTHFL